MSESTTTTSEIKSRTSQSNDNHSSSPKDVTSLFNGDSFLDDLNVRINNRNAFLTWVDTNLIENLDYQKISFGRMPKGQEPKPTLLKAGAEKICSILGIIAIFPNLHEIERMVMGGGELNNIVVKCQLMHDQTVIGEGIGARTMKQDRNDPNKALKMATKSAFLDATIRAIGLGGAYTQDGEDLEKEEEKELPEDEKTSKKAYTITITDKQKKDLNDVKALLPEDKQEMLSKWLKANHTRDEADKMLDRCREIVDKITEEDQSDELADKERLEFLQNTAIGLWMLSDKNEANQHLNLFLVKSEEFKANNIDELNASELEELITGISDGIITPN